MADSPLRPAADDAWDALLGQLRQQPLPQPRPFFYNRVQARLAARNPPTNARLPAWLRRPAYAALLGVLVFSLSGDAPGLRTGGPAPAGSGYRPLRLAPR